MDQSSGLDGCLSQLSLYSMDGDFEIYNGPRFTLSEPVVDQSRKCVTLRAMLIIDKAFSVEETLSDVMEEVFRIFSDKIAEVFPSRKYDLFRLWLQNSDVRYVYPFELESVKSACERFIKVCSGGVHKPVPNGIDVHIIYYFLDSQKIW